MTREDYVEAVSAILDAHTAQAVAQLSAALRVVPPTAQEVHIEIHVDQDGEGFLDVRIALDGPDLFALNRAIGAHADLFTTRMVDGDLEPALPLMEPGVDDFSVHDALTDCAASWLSAAWRHVQHSRRNLPVMVVSPEGYGTAVPLRLGSEGQAT